VSPRPLPGPRLRRVLALVPWIAEHPGARLADIAARFGISEAELDRDLELIFMCGLPPYTPDRLIDVDITDGRVWIRLAEYFARPVRLAPDEGLALLAAGRALLDVPGSDEHGALATALDKLERALGAGEGLSVEVGDPPFLEELRGAATERHRVEIDYYSFGRDALTTRKIDPDAVFHAFGHWYADAWCHLVNAERLFRVDRVRAVRPTGEVFEPRRGPGERVPEAVYRPSPDDPRVTLELPSEAGWVAESYPYEELKQQRDGSWRVVLAVSERAWLERLLLQLGPDVRVVAPDNLRSVAAAAAARLLGRYERDVRG
jgi:proteasome accessory factor C